jgi:hypothetical protein
MSNNTDIPHFIVPCLLCFVDTALFTNSKLCQLCIQQFYPLNVLQ